MTVPNPSFAPAAASPDVDTWRDLAADILTHLRRSNGVASWAYAPSPNSASAATLSGSRPSSPAWQNTEQDQASDIWDPEALPPHISERDALDAQASEDQIDAILDQMDREWGAVPNAPVAQAPRLNPVVVMATLRLAKTFGTAAALKQTLAACGAVTVLGTNAPALEPVLTKLLRCLSGDGPLKCKPILVLGINAAIRKQPRSDAVLFPQFEDSLSLTLESRKAVVLLAQFAQERAREVDILSPRKVALAPFDAQMLALVLAEAYPAGPIALDACDALPGDVPLGRLTPEALTLALRAPTSLDAVQAVVAAISPPPETGAGLAEFPLEPEVREAVEQQLADLQAWQAGTLPWREVCRGLLLEGPPGSGKTEIPRLIAREAGVAVIAGSLATWKANGARSSDIVREMREAFARAVAAAPAILFIDELDAVGDRARPHDHNSSWTDMIVTALLECLDGFAAQEGVVVIGATNHLNKIDAAIRRPGRFDKRVHVSYPSIERLPMAFRWHLRGELPDTDLMPVVTAGVGMSGAAIAAAVRAGRARARKAQRPLELSDLLAAIETTNPALPKNLHWQVAVHEAGHAVAGVATRTRRPTRLSIVSGGGEAHSELTSFCEYLSDMEACLVCLLAGRAAEQVILGKVSAGAGGDMTSDLARATQIAAAMEASWGLGENPVWLATVETSVAVLHSDRAMRETVAAHLQRAEARARAIITANRALVERLAQELVNKRVLAGEELTALLGGVNKEEDSSPSHAAKPAEQSG
jgi:hypothetical protein